MAHTEQGQPDGHAGGQRTPDGSDGRIIFFPFLVRGRASQTGRQTRAERPYKWFATVEIERDGELRSGVVLDKAIRIVEKQIQGDEPKAKGQGTEDNRESLKQEDIAVMRSGSDAAICSALQSPSVPHCGTSAWLPWSTGGLFRQDAGRR